MQRLKFRICMINHFQQYHDLFLVFLDTLSYNIYKERDIAVAYCCIDLTEANS